MPVALPLDEARSEASPASPLVEATLSLVQDMVRAKFEKSGQSWSTFRTDADITTSDFTAIEARILATGHRFAWSASISASERPEAYRTENGEDAGGAVFSHPDAPQGESEVGGRTWCGIGDNVVRHERDVEGVARYIRTNDRVLSYLTDGVPSGTIAVIDDSGGTLTAPIIEQFAGVICAGGTVRSHLGILTREYNIPCVMNAKVSGIADGDRVMIESSAAAKTTEDYQQGAERVARIWRLAAESERAS